MQKPSLSVLLALATCLSASITACTGGPFSTATSASGRSDGNAAGGGTEFSEIAFSSCSRCHSLEPGVTLVGPSLANVGATAGTASPGMSATAYLRQSIVDPNARVAPGFGRNVMPANYGSQLTEKEIGNLVAFLMTQR
jgi:mono/diheme cytochrome c family protein